MKASSSKDIGEKKTMNNETKEEKKRKSIIIVIFALLVAVIAAGIGITIYNTPANRLSRHLDLGEKYLEEQNYEQAVVEFDKAIAINPMNERAYIGKAEAYVGMGDYEQAAATYVTAVQNIPDGNEVWSAAEQFYLDYAQIYIDNGDLVRAAEILEEGDALLVSDRLKGKLQEVRTKQEELERERVEQERKQEEEQLEARIQECLQQIYEQMAAGNYKEAVNIFNRFFTLEETQGILLSQEKYLYFADGNMTGTGIGLYVCPPEEEVGQYEWYAYYGDYANEKRDGNGIYVQMGGSNVESVFTCEWSNDAPNGYGEWTEQWSHDVNGVIFRETRISGTFKDGLLDGECYSYRRDDDQGEEYEFTFSAVEGVPEDRTEEYFAFATETYKRIYQGLEWNFDHIYEIPFEGAYAYAYCGHLTTQPKCYAYSSFWILPGETIGVPGFADVDIIYNVKHAGGHLYGGIMG